MGKLLVVTVLAAWLVIVTWTAAQTESADKPAAGCIACHKGIEPIREAGSKMLEQIFAQGESRGDPHGCVVCHGGDPSAKDEDAAHRGTAFFPDPGSPWINKKTCGMCHPEHVRVQWHNLMMTEAGKIQGVAWTFGSLTGYEHLWANYDVENPKDPKARLGTDVYRKYKERLKILEPQVFVDRHIALPAAPTDLDLLAKQPELAAFTYMRNQCQRCHNAVKGRKKRGDYRGMGCSSCHIPYSVEGLYEGDDPSISHTEPDHCLVHTIQSTRKAKVTVNGHQYSGIPMETCAVCHNRGKRIGVSFQGLMEIPYASPYTKDGGPQPELHTKHYLAMHQDLHYKKGMLCQDCHTTIDVHSDGFLAASNLASVEIECADCHGTPTKYPWELPLGFGDEYGDVPAVGPPRGTSKTILDHAKQGTVYPPKDGYLLTARGNPYTNVVRDGDQVLVHTAAGKDLTLKTLKQIEGEKLLTLAGQVAMNGVRCHLDKMECFTCHASWTPQCYGCHVKIDYSGGKSSFDWLAAGHRHSRPKFAADRGEGKYDTNIPGMVIEERSFTRWENPAMGINGEGRVCPIAPGCQPSITVIGQHGKAILANHIFHTMPNVEGAGPEGQLAIDHSPTQPHTMTKIARDCESCHCSDKALGYGIGNGTMTRPPDQALIVDLETPDGQILSRNARVQCAAIKGLNADWSRVVTEDGRQLQTVGHHFRLSRPLNNKERANIDRLGVCLGCHQEIPDKSLAVSLLHHVAEYSGQLPKNRHEHASLVHSILLTTAWVQVAFAMGVPLVMAAGAVWYIRRRRRRRAQSTVSRGS